jgi:nicotinate-nucleotide adenylyltransferase
MPEDLPETPLGIFGGTFDPVHFGHLRLAEEARQQLGLGTVLWIPAGQPPLRDQPGTSAADRLAMVARAIEDNSAFALDDAEVRAGVASYTIDTLTRLRQIHGSHRPLVLLLGADAFSKLEQWHRWRELFDLAHIAVATRPGHQPKVGAGDTALDTEFSARIAAPADRLHHAAGKVLPFSIAALDISATAVRRQLGSRQSPRYLVPDAVLDYIHHHHLYH